ncbi:MAG: hypothetical protein QOG67_2611 [Verrucomicrobiota bacterium]|jgi:3D (Asp-Asp-Asp) domain-containing protein
MEPRHFMKFATILLAAALLSAPGVFASEQTLLARVTVYWHAEGEQQRACSNGTRLRNGHCAVDPHKIPYGSKVLFEDRECVAVDTGPAVVSRKAARLAGRTPLQRGALVIDRYFETKKEALAWADAHPHFMQVQVLAPNSKARVDNAHTLTDVVTTDSAVTEKASADAPTAYWTDVHTAISYLLATITPLDPSRSLQFWD